MQPLHDIPRRDPDRRDEQFRLLFDHDVDEFRQAALSVVVVCFASGAADGGEGEVDAERERGVSEEGFQFTDHVAQVGGGVA